MYRVLIYTYISPDTNNILGCHFNKSIGGKFEDTFSLQVGKYIFYL